MEQPEVTKLRRILEEDIGFTEECKVHMMARILSQISIGLITSLKKLKLELRQLVPQKMLFAPFRGVEDVVDIWIQRSGMKDYFDRQ